MKRIGGLALSLVAYFAVGAILVTLAHAIAAPALSAPPGETDSLELGLDLVAHALSCFAAGWTALAARGLGLKAGILGAGTLLFLLTTGTTVAWWDRMPVWYNVALLVATWPFFVLGALTHAASHRGPRSAP